MNPYIITSQELHDALQQNDQIELVDVRTLEKHEAYNIGGKHIPLEEMPTRLNEIDRNKLIVTYCTMGNRSMRALEFLVASGFTNVKSLEGGMTAWREIIK